MKNKVNLRKYRLYDQSVNQISNVARQKSHIGATPRLYDIQVTVIQVMLFLSR